jgi:hypothetical protein
VVEMHTKSPTKSSKQIEVGIGKHKFRNGVYSNHADHAPSVSSLSYKVDEHRPFAIKRIC